MTDTPNQPGKGPLLSNKANITDLHQRNLSNFEIDKAALSLIVQTAVNVELFTIPLYMTTMYSIQGMHQVTGQNDMYKGRLWPGGAPTYKPQTENATAFNTIFSVFIEEMLHLQLASNLANLLGITPKFTYLSPAPGYAWDCYNNNSTVLPGIVDFKDCKPEYNGINYNNIRVKLDDLNYTQNDLFLAIEAPEEDSKGRIKEEYRDKYIHTAPLKGWRPGVQLPMFGSIGMMYQLIWDYLEITYIDDNGLESTLFEKMYSPSSLQQDIFNTVSKGHPYMEFQGLETTVAGWLPEKAKELVFKLISAITDQGEGADIIKTMRGPAMLQAVQETYRASDTALKADYPSYTDTGVKTESTHAYARFSNGALDHYERFLEIREDIESGKIVTWPIWHNKVRTGPDKWTADDLKTASYEDTPPLPTAEDIAAALNRLNSPNGTTDIADTKRQANYKQFCEIATGAIAGITTVLDQYWQNSSVGFPFPSMGGSGDRLMMCWAVFGQVPDLSVPVQVRKTDGKTLYHACQGVDLSDGASPDSTCASAEIYHNCRGSNTCKAEGGCGFVQQVGQSKSCGSSVMVSKVAEPLCGGPTPPKDSKLYSAPGDNVCGSFGGCAVPISASQIYPVIAQTPEGRNVTLGTMELNDFEKQADGTYKTVPLPDGSNKITFKTGQLVHDIAWEAYTKVLESRQKPVPVKPKTSDIRLVFPPST
ncbi:MAG: hypothetical protein JWR12_297 [Mucilaginibacter sp.]|nr:hypothetical protein [Mucilaginibacter sp.]